MQAVHWSLCKPTHLCCLSGLDYKQLAQRFFPSIKEFSEHLANFVKSFANEVACSQGVTPGCQCALIGWSEVPGKLDGYLIEVQPSATSLSVRVEQLQIFGSTQIQTLGNAGDHALQELMAALGKKDKLRREPLQLIRKFVKNDQHDAVGGGVQIDGLTWRLSIVV